MAKYKGSVELISGLTQKNGGDFPLMDVSAIQVNDEGTRLDVLLQQMFNRLFLIAADVVDNTAVIKPLNTFSGFRAAVSIAGDTAVIALEVPSELKFYKPKSEIKNNVAIITLQEVSE